MQRFTRILVGTMLAAAAPLFAQKPADGLDLNVHLNLTDSVRQHMRDGSIAKIVVVAQGPNGHRVVADTTTDTATLHGLTPGAWKLKELFDFSTFSLMPDREGSRVTVGGGNTATANLDVPAVVVSGTILGHDGRPIGGRLKMQAIGAPADTAFAVPVNEQGGFMFLLAAPARYDVGVSAGRGSESVTIPGYAFRMEDAAAPVTIRLSNSGFDGKVVDSEGRPVAGARLKAVLSQNPGAHPVTATAISGRDGTFRMDGLAAGRWMLQSSVTTPQEVVLPEGARKQVVVQIPRQERPARQERTHQRG
jgi:hypothetical protein